MLLVMFDEEELLRSRLLDEDASSADCRPTPFMATHHDDDDDDDDDESSVLGSQFMSFLL